MTVNESSVVKKHNNKWRVVDIVVAAIIAVAAGVIFWGWDVICAAPITLFEDAGLRRLVERHLAVCGSAGRHHRAKAWRCVVR